MDASADLLKVNHRLESRVPEIGLLGSEGGATSSVVPTPIQTDRRVVAFDPVLNIQDANVPLPHMQGVANVEEFFLPVQLELVQYFGPRLPPEAIKFPDRAHERCSPDRRSTRESCGTRREIRGAASDRRPRPGGSPSGSLGAEPPAESSV